ncbi:MAG: sugar transferase [Armatimonadota bacterium]
MGRKYILYDAMKRGLDIVAAILALGVAAPILAVSAIVIKLDGGPVLFTQERVGKGGKPFRMLKLRTMVANAHKLEYKLRMKHAEQGGYGVTEKYNDPRITKIGSLLRITNLDELPQFINILKGDMSLIGPRPVPHEESLFYGEHKDEVFAVRPGLTGYWQIKRRMDTDYAERVQLDRHYVQNRSVTLDAYILLATPIAMLTSDYNSVSKPLPPPAHGVLISDEAVALAEQAGRNLREFGEEFEKVVLEA